ncbi:MAG: DHH family phosphoesterase [Nanoarchaeota archaeon]
MTPYGRLRQEIIRAAAELKKQKSASPIRLVGHLDADGISASAILVKALMRLGKRYQLYNVQQLDSQILSAIDKEGDGILVCADIGSGQFSALRSTVMKTRCIVLDHHELDEESKAENIIHINPHLFGITNSKEISGAGLSYLFAEALDEKNKDLAHLGFIGAIADNQDLSSELNKKILDTAKEAGTIEENYGLKLFGSTRPLHKVLEWSTDHPIPGVTDSENNSLAFLQSIGIKPKEGNKWRTLSDLNSDEYQKLVVGIILRRAKHKNPEAILGSVYTLAKEPKHSPCRDVREFCTLLNACGRLNKASLGIGACLGDETLKKKAVAQVSEYRQRLSEIIRWYESAQEEVRREKGIMIINAQDEIMPTMIGTLCSMIAHSRKVSEGTIVMGLARMPGRLTKVSMRVSGSGIDLFKLSTIVAGKIGGQAGGHKEAAGAIIPTISENDFIRIAIERIQKKR